MHVCEGRSGPLAHMQKHQTGWQPGFNTSHYGLGTGIGNCLHFNTEKGHNEPLLCWQLTSSSACLLSIEDTLHFNKERGIRGPYCFVNWRSAVRVCCPIEDTLHLSKDNTYSIERATLRSIIFVNLRAAVCVCCPLKSAHENWFRKCSYCGLCLKLERHTPFILLSWQNLRVLLLCVCF